MTTSPIIDDPIAISAVENPEVASLFRPETSAGEDPNIIWMKLDALVSTSSIEVLIFSSIFWKPFVDSFCGCSPTL